MRSKTSAYEGSLRGFGGLGGGAADGLERVGGGADGRVGGLCTGFETFDRVLVRLKDRLISCLRPGSMECWIDRKACDLKHDGSRRICCKGSDIP